MAAGDERVRIGVSESGERIRDKRAAGRRRDPGIVWKIVGVIAKRRLSSELQIQSAIFNVVEDSASASHYQLAVSEHVPRETKPRSKVVPIGRNQPSIGSARITGIQKPGRRLRESGGLLSRREAYDFIVRIELRRVVFVAQPIVKSEVLG